jgi:hypothetical protein
MQFRVRRRIAAVATAIAMGAGLAATVDAAPASAAWSGPCYDEALDLKVYDLPLKTDLQVVVLPCVKRDGNKLYAYLRVDWTPMNTPWFGSGHKFDSFKIVAHLERRVNGSSYDRVIASHTCDVTSQINDHNDGIVTCKTPIYTAYDPDYDYSSDGYISADIDNDGKGASTWSFHGSPLIY